ncbi:glycerol kinase GlpK [Paenibacillus filicis]|uniref:Glycerol kinase n=1 Tax=Paenibacillus gyeongsangnamensis TaxID=3388067 RepID=A0ABT4Q9T4_9BACL|nr:glycerol kinase GlpK [Paenibacillus filicis]MCZ8513546.1 glycerol kinase GlpK [Paenibacillus filicis]
MTKPKFIIALDQGTTSCRAIVFDHEGVIIRTAQREFTQYFPESGWVEHDAEEIWSVQLDVLQQAAQGIPPDEIAAIGITNQRETAVIWDRETGRPLHRAIVWQCRRTSELCRTLKERGLEPMFQDKTGLLLDPYFSGTKLKWVLDTHPDIREKAERGEALFGTIDSWLIWRLTEGRRHTTDVSNASRTLLFNIHSLEWDEDILRELDIPRGMLPEVLPSSGLFGETDVIGPRRPITIAGVAGDQQAALFGQGCFREGLAKSTYGTGCFILKNTGDKPVRSRNGLLTTIAWQIGDQVHYALEGSVFIAGAVVQWLRDGLGLIGSASETEALALSVPDTEGVYFVPAFAGLGTPYWQPEARGMIAGLTRSTGKAHLVRAALEAVAYQTRDVLEVMRQEAGVELSELRVDGGAVKNAFLMQFQADLLGVPVVRPRVTETTALGAAMLAGLAVGFWSGLEEIERLKGFDQTFVPERDEAYRENKYSGWKRTLAYQLRS